MRQVRAVKQITIHEAPNVLTVHLKRFEFGGFGSKLSKKVRVATVATESRGRRIAALPNEDKLRSAGSVRAQQGPISAT